MGSVPWISSDCGGPSCKPPIDEGKKFDEGKLRMDLLPGSALAVLLTHEDAGHTPAEQLATFGEGGDAYNLCQAFLAIEPGDTGLWETLEGVAKVLEFGAKKYAEHNWRKGMQWSRLIGAGLRHLSAHHRGETLDPESGLLHLHHFGCCVLFLLSYTITGSGTDDRYRP